MLLGDLKMRLFFDSFIENNTIDSIFEFTLITRNLKSERKNEEEKYLYFYYNHKTTQRRFYSDKIYNCFSCEHKEEDFCSLIFHHLFSHPETTLKIFGQITFSKKMTSLAINPF